MAYIGNQPTTVAFLTDQFSGTGSQTAFTLSAAPANTASIIVAVSGVLQDPSTYSVSGTTLTFSAAPPAGTGNISVRFLGIPASGVTTTAYRTVTEFTATAGQTTFTPPSYTVGYINVYRNGALLGTADYTATNGTTVVLASAASSGDLVVVESFYVSSVLNAIPATAGAVNSAYLSSSLSLVTPKSTTTIGVGNATPSTSGAGITFPATQSASSDANTLDDYEEGTWTPNIAFNGASVGVTYSANRAGRYTKIGRIVTVSFYMELTNKGSSSGQLTISTLPFVAFNGSGYPYYVGTVANENNMASMPTGVFCLAWSDSNLYIRSNSATAWTAVTNANLTNSSQFYCTITYEVA